MLSAWLGTSFHCSVTHFLHSSLLQLPLHPQPQHHDSPLLHANLVSYLSWNNEWIDTVVMVADFVALNIFESFHPIFKVITVVTTSQKVHWGIRATNESKDGSGPQRNKKSCFESQEHAKPCPRPWKDSPWAVWFSFFWTKWLNVDIFSEWGGTPNYMKASHSRPLHYFPWRPEFHYRTFTRSNDILAWLKGLILLWALSRYDTARMRCTWKESDLQ